LLPLHAPEAVHVLASVLDQVSVEEPPLDTLSGLAVNDTVGAGGADVTVTLIDCAALPPAPVQVSV
jgi:hypothetical protein